MSDDQAQWAEDFARVSSTPPEPGTILKTLDGSPVKLSVELQEGASPFIFGRAYVPDLFNRELGWYLQGADNNTFRGYKCVLLPRARAELIQKIGLGVQNPDDTSENIILVESLKIIRYSHSKSSILCEVNEYLEEEVDQEIPELDPPPFEPSSDSQ